MAELRRIEQNLYQGQGSITPSALENTFEFVYAIIAGLALLAIAVAGLGGIYQSGFLYHLNLTCSKIMLGVGSIGGIAHLTYGIVGLICQQLPKSPQPVPNSAPPPSTESGVFVGRGQEGRRGSSAGSEDTVVSLNSDDTQTTRRTGTNPIFDTASLVGIEITQGPVN